MNDKLEGRRVVDLRAEGERHLRQDIAVANARTIAAALATTEAGLVALDSHAVRVGDGEIVRLGRDALLHLVNQYIVTPVVVDRGKAGIITPPSFHI
jgi:hypothetical protein